MKDGCLHALRCKGQARLRDSVFVEASFNVKLYRLRIRCCALLIERPEDFLAEEQDFLAVATRIIVSTCLHISGSIARKHYLSSGSSLSVSLRFSFCVSEVKRLVKFCRIVLSV